MERTIAVDGLGNALVVMIGLLSVAAFCWIVVQLDNFVQKVRAVPADKYGRRPGGMVSKIGFILLVAGASLWFLTHGAPGMDPEFTWRR